MLSRPALLALLLCIAPLPEAPAGVPTMQAVVRHPAGGASLQGVNRPVPREGQVLVRMRAIGVNPIDWKVAEGTRQSMRSVSGLPISGNEGSGTIEALGPGVRGFKVGDAVYFGESELGTYAEYVAVNVASAWAKPAKLSFEEAAGVATAATTAWNSIIDLAGLTAGQKILIHGAAGGTGSAAVQIAKARGAYVIGTASPRNHDYLRALGADELIDYNTVKFEERVKDVDVVYNTVDVGTADRSIGVVRSGGWLLSIVGPTDAARCKAAGIRCGSRQFNGQTRPADVLREVAALVDAGKYRVNVDRTFPLAEYNKAWESSRLGHTRGKLILLAPVDPKLPVAH